MREDIVGFMRISNMAGRITGRMTASCCKIKSRPKGWAGCLFAVVWIRGRLDLIQQCPFRPKQSICKSKKATSSEYTSKPLEPIQRLQLGRALEEDVSPDKPRQPGSKLIPSMLVNGYAEGIVKLFESALPVTCQVKSEIFTKGSTDMVSGTTRKMVRKARMFRPA